MHGTPEKTLPLHCVTRSTVRVRFCDTDMMGVVHHSNYIKYFELARIEYLRRRGLNYASWVKMGLHLPVIEVGTRYRKPAYLDDLLVIETRLTSLSRVKVGFEYRVLRDAGDGEQEIACGHSLLACVGDDHSPLRMSREAEQLLLSPELREGELHL
jgi:acyl-CoA thioester hydrolase